MSLEAYLADQYHRDVQDIREIEAVLADVANTFVDSYRTDQNCWPYDFRPGDIVEEGVLSQGTSAMILAAIGKMIGKCELRSRSGCRAFSKIDKKLEECFIAGNEALRESLTKADQNREKKVLSRTFGDNNPLTVSHIGEWIRCAGKKFASPNYAGSEPNSPDDLVLFESIKKEFHKFHEFSFDTSEGRKWIGDNSFVLLCVVRSWENFAELRPKQSIVEQFKNKFESRLHEHLSFSSIPDSRFDPAELAFSFEGLLLCAPEAVDPILVQRVLSVLAANQETGAYWRPNHPFMTMPTGGVFLPISVEGANSLLYSVELLDENKLHGTFASVGLPMFRRFWQWLRAREVRRKVNGRRYVGWCSEHVNEPGTIHLWDTSQVVEFLLAFRNLLQRHIARETLVLSAVNVAEPKAIEINGPSTNKTDAPIQKIEWQSITERYEPQKGADLSERVFEKIYSDFIDPLSNGNPKNYSMLIYGPPGTGKTTVAESIANALRFRLVTITVSDFLGAGGALVEARAKAIFQMLEQQSNCVILFDEIDAFLLDRDSKHYRDQDTLFQFLTPGMLTKINDLRKAAR